MRNVGNHLHNVKVLRDGQGQLFVSYRQSHNQRVAADEYGPCPYCYGYYPKKILWRHTQKCKFTMRRDQENDSLSRAACYYQNQKKEALF
ncbi:hypothetical protein DPMN_011919 [Dreissena polymorpha]|uniref:Uncharacterized protein n=1 Tax=Dreissena polymorpha TaxID=45954 RepID=A0A9D4S2X0_DREPO|nr:hypothetical protein DPMN_011919 [Dreissena polymorpha]